MLFRGKAAEKDFTLESLPTTRREQFFDLFRHRFFFVLSIGLVLVLLAAPFFIAFTIKYFGFLSPASQQLSEEEYLAFYNTTLLIFDGFYILCFIIFFIGLAGVGRIYRQLAWGENISFAHDLFKGIKQNFFPYFMVGLIVGIMHFVCDLVMVFANSPFIIYIPFAIECIVFPILLMVLSIALIYKKPLVETFGNAFIICLKRPFWTLLFVLFPLGISFLRYIPYPYVSLIVYFCLVIIIFPFFILAWYLFALSSFDEYANACYYPDLYMKGLAIAFNDEAKEKLRKHRLMVREEKIKEKSKK